MTEASAVVGVHNSPNSVGAKVAMRRHVLAEVKHASVLDCYCGPTGEMWAAAWKSAESYTGIDLVWHVNDPRRRYAGDTLTVLSSIDIATFNVFDVDAFGSPWPVLLKLLRRKWKKGERGALVITDGSAGKNRFGAVGEAQRDLLNFGTTSCPPSNSTDIAHDLCLQEWLARAKVGVVRQWTARSSSANSSRGGSQKMRYSAVVFSGTGEK